MSKLTEFEKNYFIQTRQEIDTEKRERDLILNFAVVILGALSFAVVQSEKAQEFLKQPHSLMFEISTLVIITSLCWIRWKKLTQIADRWYTLYWMLVRCFGEQYAKETMEGVVVRCFNEKRYEKKDVVLNFALSLPVYTILFVSISGLTSCVTLCILTPFLVIVSHSVISFVLLSRRMRDPFAYIEDKI